MGIPARGLWFENAVRNGLITQDMLEPSAVGRAEVEFTPPAADMPERDFTDLVIRYSQSLGWKAVHFRPGRTKDGGFVTAVSGNGKGFVDLVLVRERLVFSELKALNGRLKPEQRDWRDWLIAAGAEWHEWRPSDWPEIVATLK